MTDGPGTFENLEYPEELLRHDGNELVICEPRRVQFGDYETMQRFTVSDTSVIEWRGDRGWGDGTDTRFEFAADAAFWIVEDACTAIRSDRGLPLRHWLPDQVHELPEGYTLEPDGNGVLLTWASSRVEHRARFGGAIASAGAVRFSIVSRVPLDQIESCALQLDARAAFAAAASAASQLP